MIAVALAINFPKCSFSNKSLATESDKTCPPAIARPWINRQKIKNQDLINNNIYIVVLVLYLVNYDD